MTKFEKECVAFVSGYMDAGVSAEDYVKSFAERLLGIAREELISESVTETPKDLEEAAVSRMRDPDMYLSDAVIDEIGDELLKMTQFGADWQKEQDEKEQADLFTIVALDAAQRAKEQMMKIITKGDNLEEAGTQYVKAHFRDIDWTPDVIKSCLEEAFISGGEYVFKIIKYE